MSDDLRPYEQRQRIVEAGGGLTPLGDGDFRVRLIAHGKTRDGARYYPQEALEAAAGLYDNAKMYLNHRDPSADARRGHRDVRDWAATVRAGSTRFVDGALEGVAHVHDDRLRRVLEDAVARPEMGLSQDAEITYHERQIDGRPTHVVEKLERVHSVDFVPTGNAWGRVLEAYRADEDEEQEESTMPKDETMSEEQVVTPAAEPEVPSAEATEPEATEPEATEPEAAEVAEPTAETEPEAPSVEGAEATEPEATEPEAEPTVEAAAAEAATDWRARALAAEAEVARTRMGEAVREAVAAATGLTGASRQRVIEAVSAGAILDGEELQAAVTEAVETERAHEAALAKALGLGARVRGSGLSAPVTARSSGAETLSDDVREAAREQFRAECRAKGITDAKLIERLAAAR
jgi:hypothetical protein